MKTNRESTKSQRRKLRDLAGIAYERELSAELSNLESEFRRWRAGEIDAHDLSNHIHRFHQGPARKLWSRYEPSNLEFAVADAIHRGLITKDEAGADTIEASRNYLDFLRNRESEDPVQMPNSPSQRK